MQRFVGAPALQSESVLSIFSGVMDRWQSVVAFVTHSVEL